MNTELNNDLHTIMQAALRAVDPVLVVKRYLRRDPAGMLHLGSVIWNLNQPGRVFVLAVGKASIAMATVAVEATGSRLAGGIVVTLHGQAQAAKLPASVQVFEAGHPIPDQDGVRAGEAVERLLSDLQAEDRLLVLVSGGGSALLTLPVVGVSLEDMQATTGLLLKSGAAIQELNTLRKHLDRLKGGQLAGLAAPAQVVALILSDVVGDTLSVIASGPTVPDPTSYQDCRSILEKYALLDQIPASVAAHLQAGLLGQRPETPKPGDPLFQHVTNEVIGSNRLAAEAAQETADQLGYNSLYLSSSIEGEARAAGRFAASLARGIRCQNLPLPAPACLIWGGETTVTVTGSGRGGRNQELALAAAIAMEGLEDTALLALATDGIDGPTDAAGAIVDGQTAATARKKGFNPVQYLQNNDSYPVLAASGSLIISGPTGTNVNDLLVILVGKEE